ncbi:MAG TPA: HAMP domain-containing sensor histidine kinase [Candidatus Paceibacterota bacterium]|nr:HAMP domain-containing sensor histidine kinase [Candidatus Paceibacterota bacterium]
MQTASPSLKRFAAWATGLTDNFRFNPFVKATTVIIILQIVLVTFKIGVFWWAIQYVQDVTVDAISDHITLAAQGLATPESLAAEISRVRQMILMYVFAGLVALTAVFGFLMTRFALRPARNSLQFQKRFIGNVAHEIRTPMAIIKTNTEVALMDPSIPKAQREVLEETIVELDRMSETINNLLTFDTLVRPGSLKVSPVDMHALAHTVAERHAALADSRGVAVQVRAEEGACVDGNATALDQILTNLVKNAINYTPKNEQKKVELTVETDFNGRVVVSVADQGIGIAQKDLYHIFEPFYRADTSRARGVGTGSSGLGLAIVNEIVRLHHGSISIRSALGHGTTIRVSLPRSTRGTPTETPAENPEDTTEVSVDFSKP